MRKWEMQNEIHRLRASLEEAQEDNRRLRSEGMAAMRQAKIEQFANDKALEAYYRMQDKRFRAWAIGVADNVPLNEVKEAFNWIWNGDPEPLNNFQDPL